MSLDCRNDANHTRPHLAWLAGAVLIVGISVSGCTGSAAAVDLATSQAARAGGSPAQAAAAATAITAFGLDLFKTDAYARGNVVFSPISIEIALAMARAGAVGETASQMDSVMHSAAAAGDGNGLNSLDQALAGLSGPVQVNGKEEQLALHVANAPFGQRGLALEQPFLDTLATRYGAGLRLVDFRGDPIGATKLINGWIADQTEQRIPKLLDNLDVATRLVLVNAIYMKAPWAMPFDRAGTSDQPFVRLDASTVDVPTMDAGIEGSYAEGSGWKAADVPYAGGSLAMTIVVPDDLATFQQSLTADAFARITAALKQQHVQVALPRFKTETRTDLASTLTGMGMPLAFDAAHADFSGITTQEALYISEVAHQATISVDEVGTEATAATAVVMAAASTMPGGPTVQVDRPFLFAIRDTRNGAVLFLGRIVDPSAAS